MSPEAPLPRLRLTPSLVVLVGVHLALDLALISRSWFWSQPILIAALAIPLSQLALLTIWAAVVSCNAILRFVVPILGIAACWFLMSRILPWGTNEAASAGWAIALVVLVITVFVAVKCFRLIRHLRPANEEDLEGNGPPGQIRFGLSAVMLWTTAVGLGFGFIQFGQRYWQWTAGIFEWELLGAMPIIGITNGLVAALWLWTFATGGLARARRAVRIAISLVLTGGLALLEYHATQWVTGTPVLNLTGFFIFLAVQSVVISLSLAIAKTSYQQSLTVSQ